MGPEHLADTVLRHYWNGILPVDPESIARAVGVEVVHDEELDDVSGVVTREDGTFRIRVNRNDPYVRRRFTVAHELGHAILGHLNGEETMFRDPRKNYSLADYDPKERDANRFAAALLMPPAVVRNAIVALGDNASVEELAKLFGVSQTAMKIRLESMGIISPGVEL